MVNVNYHAKFGAPSLKMAELWPGFPLRFPIFPNSEKGKIYFNEFPKLGIKVSMDFLFFLKIRRALFN